MKKAELDAQKIHAWMRNHWRIYSSQTCDKKLLRLWINGRGRYRVVYGGEILYEGSQLARAIAAWDAA